MKAILIMGLAFAPFMLCETAARPGDPNAAPNQDQSHGGIRPWHSFTSTAFFIGLGSIVLIGSGLGFTWYEMRKAGRLSNKTP
jgi:hypothetical protein